MRVILANDLVATRRQHPEGEDRSLDFGGSDQGPENRGGRDRDRTCDPYHVKVVLFR
jgi:hypothetical protein